MCDISRARNWLLGVGYSVFCRAIVPPPTDIGHFAASPGSPPIARLFIGLIPPARNV
jgi:hypothetical protein